MKELSIVIPAYNEEKVIEKTLRDLLDQAHIQEIEVEIVVVDDGSNDRTYEIIKEIALSEKRINPLSHDKNMGFGKALMTGIKNSTKEKILLVPADGQFDAREIGIFCSALDDFDLVLGTRSERKGYSLFRLLVSVTYINLVNLFFAQNYRDTNWIQAWRKKIFEKVHSESSGVFFLQETVTRTRMAGFKIGQVDSVHMMREGGVAHGGEISVILFTVCEMLRFWWKHFIFRPRGRQL